MHPNDQETQMSCLANLSSKRGVTIIRTKSCAKRSVRSIYCHGPYSGGRALGVPVTHMLQNIGSIHSIPVGNGKTAHSWRTVPFGALI